MLDVSALNRGGKALTYVAESPQMSTGPGFFPWQCRLTFTGMRVTDSTGLRMNTKAAEFTTMNDMFNQMQL